jgi:probable blue pigment (indigoidine) exporter
VTRDSGAPTPPAAPRLSNQDIGLLVLLAFLWGSAFVFIRQGIALGAAPLPFAAVRYGLSAVAFFAIAAARREGVPNRATLLVSALVGGVLVIGLYGGFLYWGEQYTTGGYAAVLASTGPIFTVVVAYAILPAERLSWRALAGIAIGFAGVVALVAPQLSGSAVGTWPGPEFVILALLSTALGTVLLRRFGGGRQGLWQIGTQFGVATLLLGAAALLLPFPRALPLSEGVVATLVALVLLASVGGYFVYFLLHHRVGPVRANIVAYLAPLVGVGVGSGFFGEPVTVWEIVGFVVVVTGVTLVIWDRSRAESEATAKR